MGRETRFEMDSRMAGIVARLHDLLDAGGVDVETSEIAEDIETLACENGGEVLFELPTEHPEIGDSAWFVLRFEHGGEEQFIHLFCSTEEDAYIVSSQDDAPADLASFAKTWTDVLTRCLSDIDRTEPRTAIAS